MRCAGLCDSLPGDEAEAELGFRECRGLDPALKAEVEGASP